MIIRVTLGCVLLLLLGTMTVRAQRVSLDPDANGDCYSPSISNNGSIAFSSCATDLVPGDTFNGSPSSSSPVGFTVFNAFGEAGNTVQVLRSCSGTGPGIPIPDGTGRTIPLVADACTTIALQSPFIFFGPVDSAAVKIQTGPTAFISITEPTSFTKR